MEQKQPLQQMVLGDLDSYVEENETRSPNYAIHKNKLKMDKRLKYESWYYKSPRGEHRQENLRYSTQQYFQPFILWSKGYKERINKWHHIKLKSFYMAKENINKMKQNKAYGKTYLPMIPRTKVWFLEHIKNTHESTPGRQTTQLKNGQWTWTDTSPRKRAQRYMKRCSASLAIREMQVKTTMRYHLTPVRVDNINKSTK